MLEADAIKLFKCLADKSRLQILKSLVKEEMYVERLAERLNLTPATISFHLKKLEDAGAVTSRKEQYYTMYSIRNEVFMTNILDIIKEESDEADEQKQREEEEALLSKERKLQEAMLSVKKRYGKNAILKGVNFEEGATGRERNQQVGGHKS